MPAETTEALAPLFKTVTVTLDREAAFELFTAGMHRWWPLATHSIFGDRAATATFEPRAGGRLFETSADGEEADWGRVKIWEPPARLVFSWHPGREADSEQEVEVCFEPVDGGTRIDLEHRDWHKLGAAAAETRAGYDRGWDPVLARYVELTSES